MSGRAPAEPTTALRRATTARLPAGPSPGAAPHPVPPEPLHRVRWGDGRRLRRPRGGLRADREGVGAACRAARVWRRQLTGSINAPSTRSSTLSAARETAGRRGRSPSGGSTTTGPPCTASAGPPGIRSSPRRPPTSASSPSDACTTSRTIALDLRERYRDDWTMTAQRVPRAGVPGSARGAVTAMCPRRAVAESARRIPGARMVTIPAGHLIHHAVPEAFTETVAAWLCQLRDDIVRPAPARP